MTRSGKTLVCILACLAAGLNIRAVAPDSPEAPYRGIVERNVFGLKAPAPPQPDAPPPPPPVKITLTGITTILGNKRALLSAQIPNKPMESYILAEGQRDSDVEVISIDEKAGSVKIINHGIQQTLDFKTDGAKLQASAMPGIPQPNGYSPIPPPPPAATPGQIPPPALRTIPTRTMRLPPPAPTEPPASGESGTPEQPPAPQP